MTEKVDKLTGLVEVLMEAIVVRQKDACEIASATRQTVRNMALRGDLQPLQADGSRINYLTLATTSKLKPRRQNKSK